MEEKIIHAHVSDPAHSIFKQGMNDMQMCLVVRCLGYERCGLYARGECACLRLLGQATCPYGRANRETGFTRRAGKYLGWMRERKKRYVDVLGKLKIYTDKLATIGDYIFLSYSHMDMCRAAPFLAHSHAFASGTPFMLSEAFTIDMVQTLCEFRPQAMMGGEITSYQSEVVPRFIEHLAEVMPDIFATLASQYERAGKILAERTFVGRKVILDTLLPNVGVLKDIHGGVWLWDGTYLTSENSHMSFGLVSEFSEVCLKPLPGCVVKVTDDGQVGDGTKLVD